MISIITRGLGSNATNVILGHFRLGRTITITPTINVSSGGGSRPMAPGEIMNFYKPVVTQAGKQQPAFLIPGVDPILLDQVDISITFSGKETTTTFVIPQKLNQPVVAAMDIFNKTKYAFSASATNVRRLYRSTVQAIRLRKK